MYFQEQIQEFFTEFLKFHVIFFSWDVLRYVLDITPDYFFDTVP